MDERELLGRREEVQARLEESGLVEKCVKVAEGLGEDRKSRQGDCYTNINYIFKRDGIVIDCNIGQNMQGDGELSVSHLGKTVLKISNSHPYSLRQDLPMAAAGCVHHSVILYEPGEWEESIARLATSLT